jgi:alginate O-acetyltransferase complex protein AlgI
MSIDFLCLQKMSSASARKRKYWLWLSLSINFLPLVALKSLGSIHFQGITYMSLPIGISFYTFKSVSYIIDAYWERVKPTKDPSSFFLFVSFFPALLSGPISRYEDFQENFKNSKFQFANVTTGIGTIIIGLAKKVCIADVIFHLLSPLWEGVGSGAIQLGTVTAVIISVALTIQLYCDFSGYTDIARGGALLFGYKLPENFRFSLFSTSPTDFWNRHHITMSQWLRDYLYYPILSWLPRRGVAEIILATNIVFFISGAWHGFSFGPFIFLMSQAIWISIWYLLRIYAPACQSFRHSRAAVLVSWLATFIPVTIGILYLLAPNLEAANKVFTAMFRSRNISGDFPWEALTITSALFLLFHGLNYIHVKYNFSFPYRNFLKPAAIAVLLILVIIFHSESASFIYYRF